MIQHFCTINGVHFMLDILYKPSLVRLSCAFALDLLKLCSISDSSFFNITELKASQGISTGYFAPERRFTGFILDR